METKKLEEILNLIDESHHQKLITKEDLISIANYSINIYQLKVDIKSFNAILLDHTLSPGEITKIESLEIINKFDSEPALMPYITKQEISKNTIIDYHSRRQNLPIYFGDNDGRLMLQIGSDDGSFATSPIKTVFDNYCRTHNPNNRPSPNRIIISYAEDIVPIMNLYQNYPDMICELRTGINISGKNDFDGRTTVVLNCIANGSIIKSYDTFQLSPP